MTIPALPGAIEVTLLPPAGGPPTLLVWRGPPGGEPVVVQSLAGPIPGRWTVQVRRWLGAVCCVGELGLDVQP